MGDSSASYIHLVHHLIETCLLFHMKKEECMEALSKHAKIDPIITSTVWKELEKENKEFFEAYSLWSGERTSEMETRERILKLLSESSGEDVEDTDNKRKQKERSWRKRSNKEFFEACSLWRGERTSEMETRERILKQLSESSGEDGEDTNNKRK